MAGTRCKVFDTETSGFSNDDEILEIGAVELEVLEVEPLCVWT